MASGRSSLRAECRSGLLRVLHVTITATVIGAPARAQSTAAASYPLADDVRGAVVPPEFFGMHLLSVWSPGTVWPPVPVGMYRLLNATPRWHDLHLTRGRWADDTQAGTGMSRIHAALLFRDQNAPGVPAVYTLAGGDRAHASGFPRWLGSARADTIAEWRRYVREVGTRFRGRILHWEVWNEPDCVCSYGGDTRLLVELTRAAAQELRAIDPRNRIISPAFTDTGLRHMERFLAAGGGAHVDVIAWHQDNSATPERDTTKIRQVRDMLRTHGLAHLPLWTTEGHARLRAGGDAAAIAARTHLVLWLFGVKSFHWYAWDILDYGSAFPGPWVTLARPRALDTPTEAGIAYREIARWMTGARVEDLTIDRDLWIVRLRLATGAPAWIVWRTGNRSASFAVPPAVTVMQTLDGRTRPWQGATHQPTERPVLFR
jgi:hypothetical protein